MSHNPTIHLKTARFAAEELVHILGPHCHQIEIAGSIRREVPLVHDIDLVVWPIFQETGQMDMFSNQPGTEPLRLIKAIEANPETSGFGSNRQCAKLLSFEFRGLPVEIYLTDPDGSNWAALLQMRTGSEAFNIRLASRAKEMGLKYRAGYGIFKPLTDERVDEGTEPSILKVLGISNYYLDPKTRMS